MVGATSKIILIATGHYRLNRHAIDLVPFLEILQAKHGEEEEEAYQHTELYGQTSVSLPSKHNTPEGPCLRTLKGNLATFSKLNRELERMTSTLVAKGIELFNFPWSPALASWFETLSLASLAQPMFTKTPYLSDLQKDKQFTDMTAMSS